MEFLTASVHARAVGWFNGGMVSVSFLELVESLDSGSKGIEGPCDGAMGIGGALGVRYLSIGRVGRNLSTSFLPFS